jgi:hypothetical protein
MYESGLLIWIKMEEKQILSAFSRTYFTIPGGLRGYSNKPKNIKSKENLLRTKFGGKLLMRNLKVLAIIAAAISAMTLTACAPKSTPAPAQTTVTTTPSSTAVSSEDAGSDAVTVATDEKGEPVSDSNLENASLAPEATYEKGETLAASGSSDEKGSSAAPESGSEAVTGSSAPEGSESATASKS